MQTTTIKTAASAAFQAAGEFARLAAELMLTGAVLALVLAVFFPNIAGDDEITFGQLLLVVPCWFAARIGMYVAYNMTCVIVRFSARRLREIFGED